MSKKDYIAFAQAIKGILEQTTNPEVKVGMRIAAVAFANIAYEENPRFDTDRFLTACGFVV